MKKIFIICMSSILFLASCSMTSVKKPSKGKSVNNISFKYMNPNKIVEEIEINSSDSFKDVYDKLHYSTIEIAQIDNSFGYTRYKKNKESLSGTNIIYDNNICVKKYKDNNNIEEKYDAYFKRTKGEVVGSYADFYYKGIYNKKSSISTDSIKIIENKYDEKGFAGNEYSSNIEYSADSGRYNIVKVNNEYNLNNKKEKETSNSSLYQYLNGHADIDNIYKSYYGYDSNGEKYTYSLGTFVNTAYIFDCNISNIYYDEDYDELYDNSVELTDKYIILKVKSKYTIYMLNDAIDQLILETDKTYFDKSVVIQKLKKLIDECYTNTYSETEVWIDYSNPYDISDNTVKKLTYGYYKHVENNNIKKKITYDVRYLNYYYPSINDNLASDLIGVESNLTYKSSFVEEIAVNNKSYKNKIKKLSNKCKKNNIFDKITLYETK